MVVLAPDTAGRALARAAAKSPAPAADETTAQRYEVKFWATEAQAAAMLRIAEPYLAVDPFCKNGAQRNTSLYLDSPMKTFYEQHLSGIPMRCKLRIRTYDDPTGPAFIEVKRRVKAVTSKHRTVAPRAIARELAAGRLEAANDLEQSRDLSEFLFLHQRHMVEPVLLVAANRLAMRSIGDNGRFRMTLDRQICFQRPNGTNLSGRPNAWNPVDLTVRSGNETLRVLFEMKFVDAAPGWLAPAIELLRLRPTSFSKYVAAMSQDIAESDGWGGSRTDDDDDSEGN
jgi:hypothetical protein